MRTQLRNPPRNCHQSNRHKTERWTQMVSRSKPHRGFMPDVMTGITVLATSMRTGMVGTDSLTGTRPGMATETGSTEIETQTGTAIDNAL